MIQIWLFFKSVKIEGSKEPFSHCTLHLSLQNYQFFVMYKINLAGVKNSLFYLNKNSYLKKTLNFHIGKLNLYLNMHIYISCSYWVISWKYVKGLWVAMIRKGPKLTDRQDTIIIPSTTHCVRYKNMVRIACDFCASTSLTIFCNRKYN